jgi:hypothetical protein
MLHDADELLGARYANHPELRTIANALLAWAETDGDATGLLAQALHQNS